MAEIVDDIKVSTIEISNESGLNLSSYDTRIKHTGQGTFTLTSVSSLDNAISIDLPNGGLDVNVDKTIDFKAYDDSLEAITIQAFNGGIGITAAQDITIDSNYYPGLSGLPTVHGILIGTNNTVPVFIGTSENNTTVNGDLVVSGNFRVDGDTVQHNVTVFDSEDPLFYLNKGVTGTNTRDIGFIGERGNQQNVGFFWSEMNKEFSAVGITPDGDDANNIITPIDNYKKMKCGGLSIVTDTSVTAITTLTVNQTGAADIANFTDNGSSALIVKDGGTVGINTPTPSNSYKLDVNGNSNTSNRVYQGGFILVPPGSITAYASGSAPDGWLICDGSAVSRTTYSTLFTLIDINYGSGDGINTFNLPNMKGRMLVGFNGADTSFNSIGQTGGSKTATLTTNELPAHTHTGTTDSAGQHTHTHNCNGGESTGPSDPKFSLSTYNTRNTAFEIDNSNNEPNLYAGPVALTIADAGAHTHTITTNSTGSGNSFAIMNPYFVINYIIKY